jgi:hypothetical protein
VDLSQQQARQLAYITHFTKKSASSHRFICSILVFCAISCAKTRPRTDWMPEKANRHAFACRHEGRTTTERPVQVLSYRQIGYV